MYVLSTYRDHERKTIEIPEIGLNLWVRIEPSTNGGEYSIIETENAPGYGPPLHRHAETEIFRVLEGRYLFEVDGERFYAEENDVVTVPGGAVHAFMNVGNKPARQYVLIRPGLDATAFFSGLADCMAGGKMDPTALNEFAIRWEVEFLGPPLSTRNEKKQENRSAKDV